MSKHDDALHSSTLHVDAMELSAMLIALKVYIGIVERGIEPSPARETVLGYLGAFSQRCTEIIQQIASGKEQRSLIPVLCSTAELFAFGSAVEMYLHLQKAGVLSHTSLGGSSDNAPARNIVERLLDIQRRYILSNAPD